MKEQGRNLQRTVTALGDLYDRMGAIDGKGTLGTPYPFQCKIRLKKVNKSENFNTPFLYRKNLTFLYSLQDAEKA